MSEGRSPSAEPVGIGGTFHSDYRVLERLGGGGMGVVYAVLDTRTQRRRALKVLRCDEAPTSEQVRRFELEATITAGVRNPHLVEVFDAGLDAETGLPFLVLELLEGENLGQRLKRGRFSTSETLGVLSVLGSVLDELHARGIVHRDLKPENLFLVNGDEGVETLRVLDFGAAKVLSTSLKTTRALGSPLYMSPEALEGEGTIDGRADVYALGHLAFTLLVGEAFWEQSWRDARGYYAVLLKMMHGRALPASQHASRFSVTLPVGFDAWFSKATARNMGDRFDTAGECVAALERVAAGSYPPPRRPNWLVLAGAGSCCAALMTGWYVSAADESSVLDTSDPAQLSLAEASAAARPLPPAAAGAVADASAEAVVAAGETGLPQPSSTLRSRAAPIFQRGKAPASALPPPPPSAAPTIPPVDYLRIR